MSKDKNKKNNDKQIKCKEKEEEGIKKNLKKIINSFCSYNHR